jgi:uncharacterized protein
MRPGSLIGSCACATALLAACHSAPESALSRAASAGDLSAIQGLMEKGSPVDARDADGWTPLIWAARDGRVEAVRFLVGHGADPNLPDAARNGWTPLLHAIHRRQTGAVAALLAGGARPGQAISGRFTPLMMAAGYGDAEAVRLLLASGAAVGARDARGSSALDYALTGVADIDDFTLLSCQDEAVRALGSAGARLEPTRADRLSAALAAVKRCGRAPGR